MPKTRQKNEKTSKNAQNSSFWRCEIAFGGVLVSKTPKKV